MQPEITTDTETKPNPQPAKPAYVSPQVTTYTDAALLEALGPAQAGGTYTVFGGP